ncbi:MAG: sulfatase-like hydrolase/transferase [Alphaproteobacteria bacterium]|nr:sulfatase-like hydrolase/transferase [Alphaproteobacteria bacterium]
MRLHDLLFGLACLAAVAHVGWLLNAHLRAQAGIQPLVVDELARADDRLSLDEALRVAPARDAAADLPDVVLIVLGGARADRFPAPGSATAAWAEDAAVFTDVLAPAPYLHASLASLATGLLPGEHGAILSPLGVMRTLPEERTTLAERLQEAGYRTVMLSAARSLAGLGLDQGFDVVVDSQLAPADENLPYAQGDRITALALAALEARGDAPVFLQVVYADAELPWVIRDGYCEAPVEAPEALPPGGMLRTRRDFRQTRARILGRHRMPTPAELDAWSTAYGSELCFLDAQLAQLLTEGAGLDDGDLVLIVGSHGQYLGEHQLLGWGLDVYQEALAVPVLARGPGFAPGQVDTPLSLIDLPGLLLDALGLPGLPAPRLTPPPGTRVAELHGALGPDRQPIYGRRFARSRRAFVNGGRKLLLSSDQRHEAYDLTRDPHEQDPVRGADWVDGLRDEAAAWAQTASGFQGAR